MTRDIVIFGAGDLAREVEFLLRELNQSGDEWNLRGFVVEDKNLFGGKVCDLPIIDGVASLKRENYNGAAVFAVGSPEISNRISNQIKAAELSLTYPNLVHPSVIVDRQSLVLGRGVIICAGCIMTTGITIGDFTVVNMGCTIAHNVKVGEHCHINPQVNISGGVTLERNVFIGSSAVIMEYKRLGENSQVSMGSVISTDVAPWTVVAGNPSRVIKKLEPRDRVGS